MENKENANVENIEVRPTIFCQEQTDPETGKPGVETQFTGSVLDLLALYTKLSVEFWNVLEKNTSADFAAENYRLANSLIIERCACIKKNYDEVMKAKGELPSLLKELMEAIKGAEEGDE